MHPGPRPHGDSGCPLQTAPLPGDSPSTSSVLQLNGLALTKVALKTSRRTSDLRNHLDRFVNKNWILFVFSDFRRTLLNTTTLCLI